MRALILLAGVVFAIPAFAQDWHTVGKFQARNNRIGLGVAVDHAWRVPLSESQHVLLKDTYIAGGLTANLSPASVAPGPYIEAVFIAPLKLRASFRRALWFGLFNSILEFDDREPDWSPDRLDNLRSSSRPGYGWLANLQAQVRLKFGPVFVLFDNLLLYARVDSVAEGNTFYHSTTDLLMVQGEFLHTMKSTVGYVISGDLKDEVLAVAAHHERYNVTGLDYSRQIVGGIGIWRPNRDWWGKPLLYVLAGTFIEDPYKEGELYVGGQIVFVFDRETVILPTPGEQ